MIFTNAAITAVILLLLLWLIWPESALEGFWVASEKYCKASPARFPWPARWPRQWWSRPAYIIINRGGENIVNSACVAHIAWRPRQYNVEFRDLDADGFPLRQRIKLDGDGMRFLMYEDDTLYGEFYRDLETNHFIKNEIDT